MLNPSTADATANHPTLRKYIGFARRRSHARITVVNLYAWIATKPRDLWKADDSSGQANGVHVDDAIRAGQGPLVAGWGAHARGDAVPLATETSPRWKKLLLCLGTTKVGAPRHPLYRRDLQELEPWPRPMNIAILVELDSHLLDERGAF